MRSRCLASEIVLGSEKPHLSLCQLSQSRVINLGHYRRNMAHEEKEQELMEI